MENLIAKGKTSFTLVIFGITGNLAQSKLLPALVKLEEKNLLPKKMKIIGVARHVPQIPQILEKRFEILEGDLDKDQDLFQKLKLKLATINNKNHLFYLATYPNLYAKIFSSLKKNGLNKESAGWSRLIIEKPLGENYKSAKKLNTLLSKYFKETQIFRIDHYLGKETLQNILIFRFANTLFEPILNKTYVDHIQISALEEKGIENRGGYFDSTGTLKDVGQNHLLQMLTATVCEAPLEFSNEEITKKRLEVLKKIKADPNYVVFGQYSGYQKEVNVAKDSQTDTFFALKANLNTLRWKGVPIYIRGGKALAKNMVEISVIFKIPENRLLKHLDCGKMPNILTYRIQPGEKIEFEILTKHPGLDIKLDTDSLFFSYERKGHILLDAYVKLIYDAISGDQTFFTDAKEVEEEWKFIDSLKRKKPIVYKIGSWGPEEADKLINKDGRNWINK